MLQELLQAEADHSCRRTYLYYLSDRKRMSNLLLRVQAEADRNCCRTCLYCRPGRRNMSNLLLPELPQEPAELQRLRRNRPAVQEQPAVLYSELLQ